MAVICWAFLRETISELPYVSRPRRFYPSDDDVFRQFGFVGRHPSLPRSPRSSFTVRDLSFVGSECGFCSEDLHLSISGVLAARSACKRTRLQRESRSIVRAQDERNAWKSWVCCGTTFVLFATRISCSVFETIAVCNYASMKIKGGSPPRTYFSAPEKSPRGRRLCTRTDCHR